MRTGEKFKRVKRQVLIKMGNGEVRRYLRFRDTLMRIVENERLSPHAVDVLLLLGVQRITTRKKAPTIEELTALMGDSYSRQRVSTAAHQLGERKYVFITKGEEDKRKRFTWLTALGAKLYEKLERALY